MYLEIWSLHEVQRKNLHEMLLTHLLHTIDDLKKHTWNKNKSSKIADFFNQDPWNWESY